MEQQTLYGEYEKVLVKRDKVVDKLKLSIVRQILVMYNSKGLSKLELSRMCNVSVFKLNDLFKGKVSNFSKDSLARILVHISIPAQMSLSIRTAVDDDIKQT